MDAAGKGGAIRRITAGIDARQYQVIPIAAPTEEERAQPYLWRFWRHIPRLGRFVLFDRSWFGRVLVERVEGFATEDAWSRAYREINEFEEQLSTNGIIICKFWLAVTKEEQMKRFKEREATERKRYKITPEDWRNRKKWDDYIVAASDMIDRTSTAYAPWTVVEANDKYSARIKVLETLTKRMRDAF
jgi:polyphosphate kinase 2 (PPK2 family)